MGAQKAMIGQQGLNPNSPSALAVQEGTERIADWDIQRMAFNARQQAFISPHRRIR
jgi:hypothetical protein